LYNSEKIDIYKGVGLVVFGCDTLEVEKKEMVQVAVRMPRQLKDLVKKYIEIDAHKDASEFYRDAIREKIQRDAPELYREQFKKRTRA
jgi:hypothetical protein